MEPTAKTLLTALPAYRDEWVMIHPNQSVHDIVKEVTKAHKEFAGYYDKVALYFDGVDTQEICDKLYKFCKRNFKYREESEDWQSTALPTGLLTRGFCDCKGYAGWIGGVLDALNRTGKNIHWNYVFASYDLLDKTPHHVFVEVDDKGEKIWVDPTPDSDVMSPVWLLNKKISGMPLYRNIGTTETANNAIGISSLTVYPVINQDKINYDGSGRYAHVFDPQLSLSEYRDTGGDRDISEWNVAEQINQQIANGPSPGHSVDGNFVKWVYDSNIRSWNFYYPGGIRPGFDASNLLPDSWPRLIITTDGRLTFDRDVAIDDYRNAEIHLLTGWAQDLINKNDPSPYPVKPQHLKEFSQLIYGNVDERNLFTERRGTSIFTDIGKGIEHTLNFVKDALLKVVGFIPRNAFLAMVGLNIFHFADNLADSINAGHWDEISRLWEGIGGSADKLRNTIEHGAGKEAIEDPSASVNVDDNYNTIGVVQVAAIIAAASPIIVMLLKFLNKDGKLDPAIKVLEGALNTSFPGNNFSFLDGALMNGGFPVGFTGDPRYNENLPGYVPPRPGLLHNPAAMAGIAGVGTYFIMRKKPGNSKYIFALLTGGVVYFLLKNKPYASPYVPLPGSTTAPVTLTTAQKLAAILQVLSQEGGGTDPELVDKISSMSPNEIDVMYDVAVTYKGKTLPADLLLQVQQIFTRYNIVPT